MLGNSGPSQGLAPKPQPWGPWGPMKPRSKEALGQVHGFLSNANPSMEWWPQRPRARVQALVQRPEGWACFLVLITSNPTSLIVTISNQS